MSSDKITLDADDQDGFPGKGLSMASDNGGILGGELPETVVGNVGEDLPGMTDLGAGGDWGANQPPDEDEQPNLLPGAAAGAPRNTGAHQADAGRPAKKTVSAPTRPRSAEADKPSIGKKIARHAPLILGFVVAAGGSLYGAAYFLGGKPAAIPPAPVSQGAPSDLRGVPGQVQMPVAQHPNMQPQQQMLPARQVQQSAPVVLPPAPIPQQIGGNQQPMNINPGVPANMQATPYPRVAPQGQPQMAGQVPMGSQPGDDEDMRAFRSELRAFMADMRERQKDLESKGMEATEAYRVISTQITDIERRLTALETGKKKAKPVVVAEKPVQPEPKPKKVTENAAPRPVAQVRQVQHSPQPAQPVWQTNGPAAPVTPARVWKVRSAMPGVAFIAPAGATRASDFVKVVPGASIDGMGQVREIRQEANGWVVVTSGGDIRS